VGAASVSLNAVLILVCAFYTIRFALARRLADHQRWAMRLFMVANGVWFVRVGLMGWIMINQSPRWMNSTMSGPADIIITYGSYLIPLAVLELYCAARRSRSAPAKAAASLLVAAATVFTAIGIFGASTFLWFPQL
jgi:cytochrome bd-type quinol oxidase subunit 2